MENEMTFREALLTYIKELFMLPKATFDGPSEESEQNVAFIEIPQVRAVVRAGKVNYRADGYITVFIDENKVPFDYFTKQIEKGKPHIKSKFFFFDVGAVQSTEKKGMVSLAEVRTSFQFLYSQQYDPNKGTLNGLTLTVTET